MNAEPAPYVTPAIQTLYRLYRPTTFDADALVGQEHVARTLRSAIRQGRLAHAYLFTGPRGTGKTSTARLLAKAANCLHPDPDHRPCNACENCRAVMEGRTLDLIEIDAASNRGIDEIRDLRDKVGIPPAQLTYRFYIIDECHQLTTAAWNAFLKTLEEPPPHAKFVLCTTEPEKLLDTVASRCQRFDFHRISVPVIAAHLRRVSDAEGLVASDDALIVIARQATGSMRDALSLLDTLASYGTSSDGITLDTVRNVLGAGSNERVLAVVDAIVANDIGAGIAAVNAAAEAGVEPGVLAGQVVAALRSLLYAAYAVPGQGELADAALVARLPGFAPTDLAYLTKLFSQTEFRLKHTAYGHLPLELAVVDAVLMRTGQAQAPAIAPVSALPTAGTSLAPVAPVPVSSPAPRPAPQPATARPEAASRPTRPAASVPPAPVLPSPAPTVAAVTGDAPPPPVPGPERFRRDRDAAPVAAAAAVAVPPPDEPAPTVPVSTDAEGAGSISLEQVHDAWNRIKQLVKMEGRSKTFGVLSDVDPNDVRGDLVILTTTSAFHCNHINEDETRRLLERVIGESVGQPVRVTCEMHKSSNGSSDDGPVRGGGGSANRAPRAPRPTLTTPVAALDPPAVPPEPTPHTPVVTPVVTPQATVAPEPATPQSLPPPPPIAVHAPAVPEAVQLQRMSNLFEAQILDPRDAPPFPDEDS